MFWYVVYILIILPVSSIYYTHFHRDIFLFLKIAYVRKSEPTPAQDHSYYQYEHQWPLLNVK